MLTEPKIVFHIAIHYVAIRIKVDMNDIPQVAPPLLPKVYAWLEKNKIVADGLPFFRYLSVDENNKMEMEVGVPVPKDWKGSVGDDIVTGILPFGFYASITHFGDYKDLQAAHMALEKWVEESKLIERKQVSNNAVKWDGRMEFYVNDPRNEPDIKKWQMDVIFLLDK